MSAHKQKNYFLKSISYLVVITLLLNSFVSPALLIKNSESQTLATSSIFLQQPFQKLLSSQELQKIDKKLTAFPRWQAEIVEDKESPLAAEKKKVLEQGMNQFLLKNNSRQTTVRRLSLMLKVLADKQNAHFHKYTFSELEAILKIAMTAPLHITSGFLTIHPKGPFAHARRGISNSSQGPAIWLGSELFNNPKIDDKEIALLLLEEAQHIAFPNRQHGLGKDKITHSQSLYKKLALLAVEKNESAVTIFSAMDMSESSENVKDILAKFKHADKKEREQIVTEQILPLLENKHFDGLKDVVGWLSAKADDFSVEVRKRITERILLLLEDESFSMSEKGIRILEKITKDFSVELRKTVAFKVLPFLENKSNRVRIVTLSLLSNIVHDFSMKEIENISLRIFPLLEDGDYDIRVKAGIGISKLIETFSANFKQESIKKIIGHLENKFSDVRNSAIYLLKEIAEGLSVEVRQNIVESILPLFEDKDFTIRLIAVSKLTEIVKDFPVELREKLVNKIFSLFEDEKQDVRLSAVRGLSRIMEDFRIEVKEKIAKKVSLLLQDESSDVREKAKEVLSLLSSDFSPEEIKEMIERNLKAQEKTFSPREKFEKNAKTKPVELPRFSAGLSASQKEELEKKYGPEETKEEKTVQRSQQEPMLSDVFITLQNSDPKVRLDAVIQVAVIAQELPVTVRQEIVERLFPLVEDKDSEVRAAVMDLLGRITRDFPIKKREKITLWVLLHLQDKDPNVRLNALTLLAQQADFSIEKRYEITWKVLPLLEDENSDVCQNTVAVLEQIIKDFPVKVRQEIVQRVLPLLQSESYGVRWNIKSMLDKITEDFSIAAKREIISALFSLLHEWGISNLIDWRTDWKMKKPIDLSKHTAPLRMVQAISQMLKNKRSFTRVGALNALDQNIQWWLPESPNNLQAEIIKEIKSMFKDSDLSVQYSAFNIFVDIINYFPFLVSFEEKYLPLKAYEERIKKWRRTTARETMTIIKGICQIALPYVDFMTRKKLLHQMSEFHYEDPLRYANAVTLLDSIGEHFSVREKLEIVKTLVPLLQDEDLRIRQRATAVIRSCAYGKQIEDLFIIMLKDSAIAVQGQALLSLLLLQDYYFISEESVKKLIPLLGEAKPSVRAVGIVALGGMSIYLSTSSELKESVFKKIFDLMMGDKEWEVRDAAVYAMGQLLKRSPEKYEIFIPMLKDVEPSVREQAVLAIGGMALWAKDLETKLKLVKLMLSSIKDPEDSYAYGNLLKEIVISMKTVEDQLKVVHSLHQIVKGSKWQWFLLWAMDKLIRDQKYKTIFNVLSGRLKDPLAKKFIGIQSLEIIGSSIRISSKVKQEILERFEKIQNDPFVLVQLLSSVAELATTDPVELVLNLILTSGEVIDTVKIRKAIHEAYLQTIQSVVEGLSEEEELEIFFNWLQRGNKKKVTAAIEGLKKITDSLKKRENLVAIEKWLTQWMQSRWNKWFRGSLRQSVDETLKLVQKKMESESPDFGKELDHAIRNEQLLEAIHNGVIFKISLADEPQQERGFEFIHTALFEQAI